MIDHNGGLMIRRGRVGRDFLATAFQAATALDGFRLNQHRANDLRPSLLLWKNINPPP